MSKRTILALAVAFAAIASIPASAAPPTRSIDVPQLATYGNGKIPTKVAFDRGMSCALTEAGIACFDSQVEASDAAAGTTGLGTTQTTTMRAALASCYPALALFDNPYYTGSTFYIAVQSAWINLGPYNFGNRTSSWQTGCAGAYLANGDYGGGARIGMPAGGRDPEMGSFDNLASSAVRCPC